MTSSARSISRQLIVWLSATLFLFWLLAVGLGLSVMRDEFGEIFDSSLQETAERLVPLVVDELYLRDDQTAPRRMSTLSEREPDAYLTYQVRDAKGNVLLHSHNVASTPYQAPLEPGFWSDERQRIYTAAAISGTIFVQVADRLDHRREAAIEGGTALLLPILFLLPISIAAISWIVRRAIAPVDQLRGAISRKDGGNLSAIDVNDLPRELVPILQSVNLLLSRLTAALEAERELTANSAHELRTPIAGARAQMQLLLEELAEGAALEPARQRAAQVDGALRRLSALNEKLLQLARAEAGIGRATQPVDLVPIVAVVVEDYERSGTAMGRIVRHPGAGLVQAVDPDAFAIVLRNLLENALIHGLPEYPVELFVEHGERVRIVNRGPLLSETQIAHLRRRFARANDRAAGSGLGLAIADRLAAQMGARLTLRSLDGGDGPALFEASVTFGGADASLVSDQIA